MAGFFESLFGAAFGKHAEKPKVPELPSLSDVQGQAAGANLANFSKISQLATQANAFSTEELLKTLEKMSPGLTSLFKKQSDIISGKLSGEIPEDVSGAIARSTAAKAMAGGFGGSSMGRNLTARDLGLTSLDIQNQGMQQLSSWTQLMGAITPQFNFGSMFVSPAMAMGWAENQFQRDWSANQIAAMLSPKEQAWNQVYSSMGSVIDYIGSSMVDKYTGNMGGGGKAKIGDWSQTQMDYLDWMNSPEGIDFSNEMVDSYYQRGQLG